MVLSIVVESRELMAEARELALTMAAKSPEAVALEARNQRCIFGQRQF